jgi:protein-S-isoprenylcysteine O-methyltransferase Ste14
MTGLYKFSLILIICLAVIVFISLFFISAPYGKFIRKGWGPSVKSKWAWMIMELPSPVLMAVFFVTSPGNQLPQVIFISLWLMHYLHRTFIYPFRQSGLNKPYPVLVLSMAFVFNIFNGFINGFCHFRYLSYSASWLLSWQFISGLLLFITGFIINKTADEKLKRMRKDNPDEYVIPAGWLFNYISSPHYFGEILEWSGWALLTFSPAGLAFALFTFANLFPRAWASHKWYRSNFANYPADRKAVIPFIV